MDNKRIDILGGYVELLPFVTRRMSRDFTETLTKTANINSEGKQIVTAEGVDAAAQGMILAMIKRVVVTGEDGVEKEITASEEWLDQLPNKDFTLINKVVQEMYDDGREKAKK